MYEQFYGLREKPFALTPNPRYVFYSHQYHEAAGQLIYGINNREGFMLVTGEPGTGKTTLCRDLIEKLDHDKSQSALIFNPFLNGMEMLAVLLTEFGIIVPHGATRKELLDRLNQFLLAQLALGKSCVAIFDEAQHLAPEFLEQIRVLSNLETDQEKLIQIILVGQPELLTKIRAPKMAQLQQRVSIRCTLKDLTEDETDRYIHHRLNVAGAHGQVHFSPRAVKEVFRGSHGVPRLINLISDRALLAGYSAQTHDIQPAHVFKAIGALRGEDAAEVRAEVRVKAAAAAPKRHVRRRGSAVASVAAIGLVGIAAAGVALWPRLRARTPDDRLFAQTVSAGSDADVERNLVDFVARYPNSEHYGEAMIKLARLEISRGDQAGAIQRLTQFSEQVPSGIHHASAMVLIAQARLDNGDTTAACQGLTPDLPSAVADDNTLSDQLTTMSSLCASRPAASDDVTSRRDSAGAPKSRKSTTSGGDRKRPSTQSRSIPPGSVAPKP